MFSRRRDASPPPKSAADGPLERTLLDWLRERFPDAPRSRVKEWIVAGRVSVGGRGQAPAPLPDARSRRSAGSADAAPPPWIAAADWRFTPSWDCCTWMRRWRWSTKGRVFSSLHPGEFSALIILRNFLAERFQPPAWRDLKPLPVHRLDQYTTGVFCMAMNPAARAQLIEQIQTRALRREYVAYAQGRPSAARGTWRHWLILSRDELWQRVEPVGKGGAPLPDASEAITHYEVVAVYELGKGNPPACKLRLRLETGRKHQIRAQAAAEGLPLIGDPTYNPACRKGDAAASGIEFPRQALHAEILEMDYPEPPGKRMQWRAPLPADLRRLEGALKHWKR